MTDGLLVESKTVDMIEGFTRGDSETGVGAGLSPVEDALVSSGVLVFGLLNIVCSFNNFLWIYRVTANGDFKVQMNTG